MTVDVAPLETAAAPPAAPAAVPAAPVAAPAADTPPADGTLLQPVAAVKPLAERIPEKYRTLKEDGTLDVEASLGKVEDARDALEKRLGTGDIRPKAATDYKLDAIPANLAPILETLPADGVKAFQEEAHAAGLTQKQYDFVMSKFLEAAPALAGGARALDRNAATTELRTTWPDQATFDQNIGNASKAVQGYGGDDAQRILLDYGNDPRIVRMMAKVGAEMGEAKPLGNVGQVTADTVDSLRRSEAYTNAKHPDHAKVSAQVAAYNQQQYGTGRAM